MRTKHEEAVMDAAKRLGKGGQRRFSPFEIAIEVKKVRGDRFLIDPDTLRGAILNLLDQGALKWIEEGDFYYNTETPRFRLPREDEAAPEQDTDETHVDESCPGARKFVSLGISVLFCIALFGLAYRLLPSDTARLPLFLLTALMVALGLGSATMVPKEGSHAFSSCRRCGVERIMLSLVCVLALSSGGFALLA